MAKKSGGMSKVAMVRDAIAKLGWDVKVEEYHQYILDTYKSDMSKAHISQTKSNEKKRQGISPRKRRKKGGVSSNVAVDTGSTGSTGTKVSDLISFISEVQRWESKIGAENIREVVKNVLRK